MSRRFIPPEVPPVALPPNEKIIWNSHPLNPPMADIANLKVKSAQFKKQNKRRPWCTCSTIWHIVGRKWLRWSIQWWCDEAAVCGYIERKGHSLVQAIWGGSFPTTVALQSAFLGRFRKEKTPSNIRKKLEKLRQRDLLLEVFAHKFMDLYGRLEVNE